MNDQASIALAFASGLALGAIFYGGLWWTVRRGLSSPRSALWFFGSFVARTLIVLAGFYFVGAGQWQRLLACFAGFVIARPIVNRFTKPQDSKPTTEDRHAP